ncbi:MAG: TetR family transcriptional regulator C-terminal domain-containing protein [Limisphaerales bacterium]
MRDGDIRRSFAAAVRNRRTFKKLSQESQLISALRPMARIADPIDGLVESMCYCVRKLCDSSDARLWMEVLAESARNIRVCKFRQEFDRDMREILKSLIHCAGQLQQVSPNLDSESIALWMIASLDGTIARYCVQPNFDIARARDFLTNSIRRHFCSS